MRLLYSIKLTNMKDEKDKKQEDNTIHTGAAHSRGKEDGNEMHESADRPKGSDHGDQGRASYTTGTTTQGGSDFGQGSSSLGGESYKQGDTKNAGSDYANEKDRFAETGTGADGLNTGNRKGTSNQDAEGQQDEINQQP